VNISTPMWGTRKEGTMTVSNITAMSRVTLDGTVSALENDDRLTRAAFERRYAAMPHLKKAELIKGVVYVPSPLLGQCPHRPCRAAVTHLPLVCFA
jgi:hypothetical protein